MSYSAALRDHTKTAPQTPQQVIQVVADVAVQEWAKQNTAIFDPAKVPYKISASDTKQFNIYAGEVLFALKPSFYRDFGLAQPVGARQAVLSSAVGIPAYTQDQTTAQMTPKQIHDIGREKLEEYASFWGVSEGNYYGHDGPEKSSVTTGFTSMHSGVKTVVCFSKTTIAPGTRVRMGFVPYDDLSTGSNSNYRGGPTMCCKATLIPVDGNSTFEFFKLHLPVFKRRLTQEVPVPYAGNLDRLNFGHKLASDHMNANSHYQDTAKKDALMITLVRGFGSLFARIYSSIEQDPILGILPIYELIRHEKILYDCIMSNSDFIFDDDLFLANRNVRQAHKVQHILNGVKPLFNAISQRVLDERPIGVILKDLKDNTNQDPMKAYDVLVFSPN
jgi:hypothetical protein